MIEIEKSVVLITGADGGIGSALLEELIRNNVKKIYATGRNLESLQKIEQKYSGIVVSVVVDVTDPENVKACAEKCSDTTILINNAGVELKIPFIAEKASVAALFEMKVNYIGVLDMVNCFLPHLKTAEAPVIVNILSMGSLVIVKRLGTYCASKAATHIFTETIREELKEDGIKVIGVYPGYVNTNMVPEEVSSKKSNPIDIAREICKGISKGEERIFPDEISTDFINNNPIDTKFYE